MQRMKTASKSMQTLRSQSSYVYLLLEIQLRENSIRRKRGFSESDVKRLTEISFQSYTKKIRFHRQND